MKKTALWALLPLLMVSCAKPTAFDFLGVKNVKVLRFGFKESTVAVDIQYYNPNKFPVTMKRADVDVYVNDNFFGNTKLDSTIKIPRRDTFELPVLLKVNMNTTVMQLIQTLGNGGQEVKVKLDGNARVGRGGLFINYPINYEGMQKLGF